MKERPENHRLLIIFQRCSLGMEILKLLRFRPEKISICFVEISDLAEYKNISSRNSLNPHFRDYNIDVWKEIIDVFSMRISCLLGNAEVISYEQYLDEANPHDIFMCERALAGNNKVFIISAFPEFLVDYFGMKLWKTCVKHAKNQLDICNCK